MRKNLRSIGDTKNYLKYAIGEIILVVLGILIALAINNANQVAKDRNIEKDIIVNVHSEFTQNKKILANRVQAILESEQALWNLLNLMNKFNSDQNTRRIDSLIYKSIDYSKFIPSQITVSELVQTGKIALITNRDLKEALFEWSVKLDNINNTHSLFEKWIEEVILPYLSENIALRNVDVFSDIGFEEGSTFDNGYLEVFQDRTFENILDNHLYHHSLMNAEYENLKVIIDKIIKITGSE